MNIFFDGKLDGEIEAQAEREGRTAQDQVEFLVREALRLGVRRTYNRTEHNPRPQLIKGDLCRLSKRARNANRWLRNKTFVVVKVDTTVLAPVRNRWRSGFSDGVAVCGRGSTHQDRRVDPENGYCSITVAYKNNGKWQKVSFHRKDLYKVR